MHFPDFFHIGQKLAPRVVLALLLLNTGILHAENEPKRTWSLNPFKKSEEKSRAENEALLSPDPLLTRDESGYIDKQHKVHDLAYGEALLDFFTQNYYESLIKTNVGFQKQQYARNNEHALLLQAQLYVIEGLPEEAEQSLDKIRAGKITQATLNQIYFQLARMYTYQGKLEQGKNILINKISQQEEYQELEHKILLANIYAIEGDKDALAQHISSLNQIATQNAYIKYNLANAGIITGNEEFFLPILIELTQTKRNDLETRSIQDFANLSLGKYYLQKDEFENAKLYLKAVGYEGLYSSEALYLLAWIELQTEQYKTSFAYWVNLSKRNPFDVFVGKSYLYKPYALEKLKSTHLALSGYDEASEFYDRLIADVDATIEIVNSDTWLEKLLPPDIDSLKVHETQSRYPSWIRTQQNETNFLLDLYASNHFAVMRQNVWELELLKREMEKQRHTFEVFKSQNETHHSKFDPLIPEAKAFLSGARLQSTRQRVQMLEQELIRINHQNDFLAAPTEAQAKYLQRIEYIHSLLDYETEGELQQQRDYLRLLEGINAWQMNQTMNERQWKIRAQYDELQTLLAKTEQHQQQIVFGIASVESSKDYMPTIVQAAENVEFRINQLELLSLKHQKYIRELALKTLDERKREYKNFKAKAKLATARLQDSIVTGESR